MPSKSRYLCAQKDDLIWQKLEEGSDASICTSEAYRKVSNFILKYKDVKPGAATMSCTGWNLKIKPR